MRGGRLWAAVRGWTAYGVLRVALGCILLTAAGLKAHQVATDPLVFLGGGWLESRPVVALAIGFEVFLGLWLVSGIYATAGWKAALACFTVFAGVSLYKAISGSATCGCFGRMEVNPWWTFSFDVTVVMALGFCRLQKAVSLTTAEAFGSARKASILMRVVLASAGLAAALATFIFGSRQHDGPEWVHDFGIVEAGKAHRHLFQLMNTSGRRLEFDSFRATCSCTGLTISKRELKPGERFDVSVDFRAAKKAYDAESNVLVAFRGEKPWAAALRLIAKVRAPLSPSTSELRWESIGASQLPDASFLIRNYSGQKWARVSLISSEPWLNVGVERVEADEGALETWECTAHLLPSQLSAGEHQASIIVAPTGLAERAIVRARVSIQDPVVLIPGRVFHIRETDGAVGAVDLAFAFRAGSIPTSPKAFVVTSGVGDAVRTEIVRGQGDQWVLRCHVPAGDEAIRGELRVDIPSAHASLTVPVYVSGRGVGGGV